MRRSLPTHGFTALSFCLVTVIMTQIYGFSGKKLNQSPKTILHGRDAILRVRVKWLIFNIVTIIGRREVSRSYRVWFFAEGERFLFLYPQYLSIDPQHLTAK